MTEHRSGLSTGHWPLWRAEAAALWTIGAPMALTQLVQFSINTIDVLMIGQLGAAPLAAASLGQVAFYFLFVVGLGPAMAVSPMASQAIGSGAQGAREARRSVRMGLWAVAGLSMCLATILPFTEELALGLGQPAAIAAAAEPYALALGAGLPFALGVIILRNFLAAIDRTRAPLLIIAGTTLLNAGLNALLIYGMWGAPRLELVGAGVASAISHAVGFAALAIYCSRERVARTFELFHNWRAPDWPRLIEVGKLGWPISITIAFEAMLFNACILLMGRIGVMEMAAYQIAINIAALAFMGPLGLSMAGGVRVGLMAGRRDMDGVRRAALVAILSCIGLISIFAAGFVAAPQSIAALYVDAGDPGASVLLALVASFLPIAAAFALFDATQVAAAQALRGLKDVRVPMIITGVAYWPIGFSVAAYLGLATPIGAQGVWVGLLSGLATAAILLSARLWRITRDDHADVILGQNDPA